MKNILKIISYIFIILLSQLLLQQCSDSNISTADEIASIKSNSKINKHVVVYTIDGCSYCAGAKNLLRQNNISFSEVVINPDNSSQVSKLRNKSGMRTYPQIFYGDKLIGGYAELKSLDNSHGLKNILK